MLGILEKTQICGWRDPTVASTRAEERTFFRHLLGLPLHDSESCSEVYWRYTISRSFWEQEALRALFWQSTAAPIPRRSSFPSRCWTGWAGYLSSGRENLPHVKALDAPCGSTSYPIALIEVDDSNGNSIILEGSDMNKDFDRFHTEVLNTQAKFLSIQTAAVQMQVHTSKRNADWELRVPCGKPSHVLPTYRDHGSAPSY